LRNSHRGLRRYAFGATIDTPRPPLLTLIAAPFSSLSRHTEDEILALEREHSIEFAPSDGGSERANTEHIDFLQVRNGAVHILDYKPDAHTNKPIVQLAIYALARRAPGLKLFDIKCARLNEEEYCEMFPRTLFSQVRSEENNFPRG
jgi:hypothetical protein